MVTDKPKSYNAISISLKGYGDVHWTETQTCTFRETVLCHEKFGPGKKSVRPDHAILATKSGPAGLVMTPKFVRLIQNWSGHIGTLNMWRLWLIQVKREMSKVKLVEEAYEYLPG